MHSPVPAHKVADRYEIKEILGQGGMGLVYRARDLLIRRDVALKTLRDIPQSASLQLFYKECDVLASISHPNIVEIFDVGEFEEEGAKKPYFVMPLLPGKTLDKIIKSESHRLTLERAVDIISQVCRGLQAAHERGLVHRDLKPSNIFVMADDSVKIIDFGIAHMNDGHSTMGQKGTLLYMSPEQIEMKPLSGSSDIFSLSVVCYEALTGRQPFRGGRDEEIVAAILHQTPPPACELNPIVGRPISRVIHKGMAKQPWHRFSTARDFADTIHKALRNEPIEYFDSSRLRPRLQRCTKAVEDGDYQFAGEILSELEAEGHIDTEIGQLRVQLDSAVRQKTVAQLIESAKARYEDEEYPLALQKIQEILQFDPQNFTALSLKNKIESRRCERQIDNWYRLAQQHIENHAYTHAREALKNVMQLKPQEARAVQLLSEIDQEERKYNKLRQEKAQLHRAAMDAWQRGDVSAALTKLALVLELDRRAPDSSEAEPDTTYQTFYNQVHSEHDAINNAYAEARKHLADGDFAKALSQCDTLLAKYPNHTLFQALKFDIGERQRQELSSFIASVDRNLEAEPDLDKKVNLLKDALSHYPGEAHFERALHTTQDKRDLVNSIVTRAQLHEEQNLFADALNDWEILSNIYNQYPGLKFEIERLQKRREQQSRAEAKAQITDQIDQCMQSAQYARALELLQQAQPEFPGDPELAEMQSLAQAGLEKTEQAQRLMTEGHELCAQHRFKEGLELLEQAFHIDEHNAVGRNVLCNALLEQARALVDADWRAAEDLTSRALDLDPEHPQAKSMRSLIQDRKREQFLNEFMSQARKMHAAADLTGALSKIDETLLAYPGDFRLLQMREALQREVSQSQLRQERRQDLDELRRLQREVEGATDQSLKSAFSKHAQTLAGKYPNDEEFVSVAKELAARTAIIDAYQPGIQSEESQAKAKATAISLPDAVIEDRSLHPASPSVGEPASESDSHNGASVAPGKVLVRFKRPQILAAVLESVLGTVRRIRWPRFGLRALQALPSTKPVGVRTQRVVAALCGLVGIVIVLALVIPRIHSRPKQKILAQVAVHIRTIPAGANILVGNEVRGTSEANLNLPLGAYTVTAQMDGYEPSSSTLEVRPGPPVSLEMTLHPAPLTFRLMTDAAGGKVWLDNRMMEALNGGQVTISDVTPGKHQLRFATANGETTFTFEATHAALPVLGGTISTKGVNTLIVAGLGRQMKVYNSFTPAQLSVDDQPAITVNPEGLELPNISPGNHQLSVTQASQRHTVNVNAGPAPSLSAFVQSNQNIGTLLIVTAEDRVSVYLDGRLQKRSTEAGELRIANLEPRQYQVRVARDGFQEVPEQKIEVRKGEEARAKFVLQPVARLAVLAIQGGMPGTEVLMDQVSIGTVQPDGSFRYSAASPGDHTLELRKDRYQAKQIQKRFTSGSPVSLGPADATLEPMLGELHVKFSPPEADVTLSGNSQASIKLKNGSSLNLPSGSYSLTARTSEGLVRSFTVKIASGESRTLDLVLTPGGMSDWEQPESWAPEKDYFVHRGGNFVLYRTTPTAGTFSFSALVQKGHRLQWVLNYMDAKNYLAFSMDENFFYRSVVRDGHEIETAQFPHRTDKKQFRSVQIRVSRDEIVHQIREGNQWVTLDTWTQPGTELSAGRFGFLIPGKDQVALSYFKHYADLNTQ